jgi:hypothetical protein
VHCGNCPQTDDEVPSFVHTSNVSCTPAAASPDSPARPCAGPRFFAAARRRAATSRQSSSAETFSVAAH